jgi:putative lipoic acid-binding regulatory protein
MKSNENNLKIPCSFPIKVMGLSSDAFISAVLTIFRKHLVVNNVDYSSRSSASGKYLSITVTITAESQKQLNAIYEELNSNELVVMTL